jgi:lipopolysaccharide/colanic/teichoic acid biosynthesis glycosyltransferase
VREEALVDFEPLAVLENSRTLESPADADLVLGGHGEVGVLALAVVGRSDPLMVAERAVLAAEGAMVHGAQVAEETVVQAAAAVERAVVVAARRTVEVAISLVGLAVLVLLLPVVALAIKLDSPGPVIFRQVRLSKGGGPFTIYKLRTMTHDAEHRLSDVLRLNIMDGPSFKAVDDPRVTRVGRLLRRFSLDELPQFWNVLRGDMALVGPRPPLPIEWAHYSADERARLAVRPGITGHWQVSGRNHCPHQQMVELDLEYVRRRSLWLDLAIIVRTLPSMLRGSGAY